MTARGINLRDLPLDDLIERTNIMLEALPYISAFRGAVMVGGLFTASGTMDFATINYDAKVLQDMRMRHNYRIAGAISRY